MIESLFWLAILLLVVISLWWDSVRRPSLPGPPSLPVIGNLHHVSTQSPWIGITALGKRYGDVTYFHGLGYNVLVLNTRKSINDLLEKRADIYSHRPRFVLGGELMGMDQSTPLMNYGPEWREHRKLAHGSLSSAAVKRYHRVQEDIAAVLCKELLNDPTNFYNHARVAAGRVVMSVTYGLSIEAGSTYVKHTEDVMEMAGRTIVPAAHLCDVLPVLKYLPSWVPFRRYAEKWKAKINNDIVGMPFEHVKEEMRKGTAVPSLATDLLASEDASEQEHHIKWVLGSMFNAMAQHPDKQQLAQAEIDQLLQEENRMPLISDMPSLPYVSALIKETLRWHPILPFSIARQTAVDDEYLGHKIAKGTIVMPNAWAVAFTPNEKYDPDEFLPERFMDKDVEVEDPFTYVFGFGRRTCPGKALAQNSLSTFIPSILYSFNISLSDEDFAHPNVLPGLVSYPEPFQCHIVPRSKEHAERVKKRAT
ncbi:cytochrome p450 [Moniliophthora roreri]|uniref:Cytochrome p450 n=1 Tax=Moniliophthora roreri TaxID=221103 RepID=A0A0W0FJC0_MONRR|nr:cytochrome p450 [Moniliophthora roreri]